MKYQLLSQSVAISFILSVPFAVGAQEKSITLEQALEIVYGYYDDPFEYDYYWLSDRTEQWAIWVDEEPDGNWAHSCATYVFPNTGDLDVDVVPVIDAQAIGVPPNETIEYLSVIVYAGRVESGKLWERLDCIWDVMHSLTVYLMLINEDDFDAMRKCIWEGRLANIAMDSEIEIINNAIPDNAFNMGANDGNIPRSNLRKILLPEGLESIGERAFYNCDLNSIIFPASVKTFGEECCCNWNKIQWIYSKAPTPPVCDGSVFGGSTPQSIPIYVPFGTADLYRNAPGWNYFTTFIETDKTPSSGVDAIITDKTQDDVRVYWENGVLKICIASELFNTPRRYTVYSSNGRKLIEGRTHSATTSIPLPEDFYIVTVNNKAFKVK